MPSVHMHDQYARFSAARYIQEAERLNEKCCFGGYRVPAATLVVMRAHEMPVE